MHATRLQILAIMALATLSTVASAAEKASKPVPGGIVKWVDEKGVTHYGDSLPAQYTGRDNSVINSQGIVLKQNRAANDSNPQDQAALEQQRRDRALLATFTTAEEIDLARDRNLQMDKTALHGLQQRLHNAQEHLTNNRKAADAYTIRKRAVPTDLADDIKKNKIEIANIEAQIAQRNTSMEATQKRFDEDKRRFSELKANEAKPREAGR